MTPQQALDFLAAAAREVLPIKGLDSYNAAVSALAALIKSAADKPEAIPAKADK